MATATRGDRDALAAFVVSGEAGSVIYKTGDVSTDLYIIRQGQIELVDDRPGEGRLALLELGDFFGERALFDGQPRDHTARAATPYTLVRLDWPTFQAVVQYRPDVAVNMLRVVSRRSCFQARPSTSEHIVPARPSPAEPPNTNAEVALVHAASGVRYRIARETNVMVGRRDRAKPFIPDIDLTDLDTGRTLSRRHLRITWQNAGCFAEEATETANGSFINGHKLKPGVPTLLRNGDRVQLGVIELVFEG